MNKVITKRISRWLQVEGEWDTIWNVIKDDPVLVDHVYKYLHEKIVSWEYANIPAAQLDKEQNQ